LESRPYTTVTTRIRFPKGEQNGRRKNPSASLERSRLGIEGWQGLCRADYYLNELTVPLRALMNEGYEINFANPKGNTPQLDVNSAIADFFGGDEAG
jgi:hypothetical protein